MSFKIDIIALLLLVLYGFVFTLFWRWKSRFSHPYIFFSDIRILTKVKKNPLWLLLPRFLLWLSLGMFGIAFIDPYFSVSNQPKKHLPNSPKKGLAIYLVLDQSGSMKENVAVYSKMDGLYTTSKIDLLKKVSKQFILGDSQIGLTGRSEDMIGLIFFARGAQVQAPLTLDHSMIVQELDRFNVVSDKDQDGTSIGYALYKTANMIAATKHYAQNLIEKGEPAFTIENSVIILVTDGLQDPNPLDKGKRFRNIDIPEAAAYIQELGIRLYIVNVEPSLNSKEFEPYKNIMTRAAKITGGQFFPVDSLKGLEEIYRDIDKLETSVLPNNIQPKSIIYQRQLSLYPFFVFFGLCSFFTYIILETLIIRRVP